MGSTAFANDCPPIAESCACQSVPSAVQAPARPRRIAKRASTKSAPATVSKSESVASDQHGKQK
jgi:hypothetical protein